jgi:hypothetical protein
MLGGAWTINNGAEGLGFILEEDDAATDAAAAAGFHNSCASILLDAVVPLAIVVIVGVFELVLVLVLGSVGS